MPTSVEDRPLRVGIICYPLIGGSGILATALGTELARRGHEAHFFSYECPVRLNLSVPRVYFHQVQVSEYSLFKYPDYTLPLAVKLAAVSRERGLDILHAHYAVPHAAAAYLAVQMLGGADRPGAPRIVTTLHGTDTTLLGRDPNYRPAIEYALSHSDAITTVSESLRRETVNTFGLEKRGVEVIHNFFEPSAGPYGRDELRRELGVSPDTFLVVHHSNLRPGKRIDLLLETFAAVLRQPLPVPVKLLVLGGGEFAGHQADVDKWGLHEHIIVRENVPDVEAYLDAADAGLSASESESFGLSLLEVMAHGKPVAAFAVGGISEVVRGGCSGLLCAFGDTDGLADAVCRLAASPELARSIGERAGTDAAKFFSTARIVPQYEAVYRRLLVLRGPYQ